MNAQKLREERRRRILENSEGRLKKITSLSTKTNELSEPTELLNEKNENIPSNFELSNWSVPKRYIENVEPSIPENKLTFNYESNNYNSKLHSKNVNNFEIKFSTNIILQIILSQIGLMLFYYDFGYIFGNSVVVPFFLSCIPELYTLKDQHDNIYMIVLLMLGFSQNFAKQISRCVKLASTTGKRFCLYIFCFTCSYAILTNQFFNVKQNNNSTR